MSLVELLTGERGRGVGGAKSYDGEKACSTINNSILSELDDLTQDTKSVVHI